jgi:hypothetical protein
MMFTPEDTPSSEPMHFLKILPAYYKAVKRGDKSAELRQNDRDYQKGDRVVLEEWDPKRQKYTGNTEYRIITHVCDVSSFVGKGWVMLSLASV